MDLANKLEFSVVFVFGQESNVSIGETSALFSKLIGNCLEVVILIRKGYELNLSRFVLDNIRVNLKVVTYDCAEEQVAAVAGIAAHCAYSRLIICYEPVQLNVNQLIELGLTMAYYEDKFLSLRSEDCNNIVGLAIDKFALCISASTGMSDQVLGIARTVLPASIEALLCATGLTRLVVPLAGLTSAEGKTPRDWENSFRPGGDYGFMNALRRDPNLIVSYDWSQNMLAEERCLHYLSAFREYEIYPAVFTKQYRLIGLIQTYNEQRNIQDCLKDMSKVCDGIILLDDDSTDSTFDLAEDPKLLLKVKKDRTNFNDLDNRNILLDLASFYETQWLIFIDADERFDPRYRDFSFLDACEHDVFGVWWIHLWDSKEFYRADVGDASLRSKDGVLFRSRLFKSYGHMQIKLSEHALNENRQLHFPPVPFMAGIESAPILVHHYGNLNRVDREKKYSFYLDQDKSLDKLKYSYQYLLDGDCLLRPVSRISISLEGNLSL